MFNFTDEQFLHNIIHKHMQNTEELSPATQIEGPKELKQFEEPDAVGQFLFIISLLDKE